MPPTEIGEALKVPPEPLTVPSDQISASAETLALPIYSELTEAQQQYVVETIAAFYGQA